MIIEKFVDPYTKEPLMKDSKGNLYRQYDDSKVVYKNYDGCYDFVISNSDTNGEREYYDKERLGRKARHLTLDLLKSSWFDETQLWLKTLLDSLGELSGKRILLLGNGLKDKELYFLHLGANIVYTDLSLVTVRNMKQAFSSSELNSPKKNAIEFHAVDAMHLPFPDNSFDIIYGSAFVHHLDDLDPFFTEVYRCLKDNGICRFFDQADSPLWETMKRTVLRPFQLYSYWKYPRSPEDLRAVHRKVFNKAALFSLMKKHRFKKLVFIREWFLLCIVWRHYGKSVGWDPNAMRKARPLFLSMKWIDNRLSGFRWMKNNQLMLTWGFDK